MESNKRERELNRGNEDKIMQYSIIIFNILNKKWEKKLQTSSGISIVCKGQAKTSLIITHIFQVDDRGKVASLVIFVRCMLNCQ